LNGSPSFASPMREPGSPAILASRLPFLARTTSPATLASRPLFLRTGWTRNTMLTIHTAASTSTAARSWHRRERTAQRSVGGGARCCDGTALGLQLPRSKLRDQRSQHNRSAGPAACTGYPAGLNIVDTRWIATSSPSRAATPRARSSKYGCTRAKTVRTTRRAGIGQRGRPRLASRWHSPHLAAARRYGQPAPFPNDEGLSLTFPCAFPLRTFTAILPLLLPDRDTQKLFNGAYV